MVYIWVNTSDPKFIRELNRLSRQEHANPLEILVKNRYRDWGTLKYSLRSVEKFAPWIRTVHLVTSGQIPYWLNMDNRRINIINHKEIFPNRSDLPTFSSAAIECHLHRILGLSKRFIYMRDDVIFTDTVELSYFYTEYAGYKLQLNKDAMDYCNKLCRMTSVNNGICEQNCATASCEFDGEDCIIVEPLPDYIEPDKIPINSWQASLRHTGFIFNKVLGPKDMIMPIPGPYMLDRDIVSGMTNRLVILERRFTRELKTTSSAKIENNMTFQPVFAYYNYLRDEEQSRNLNIKMTTEWSVLEISHTDLSIRQKDPVVNLLRNIIKRNGTFLVLSNDFPKNVDRESRERIFTQVLEDILPRPSQFEVMKHKAIQDHSIPYQYFV
ncbi:uncharacterized protein LOC132749550 [Ruditapes philippinarum]|uniref:uncharacterized protein LOC132749550 n=1 Tax=Ruditapes philippinarum TaxID=129788 RepID=UPI00295BC818|nr:uncharacterized protein LOC132749550 [Ruditapes philippinarum]